MATILKDAEKLTGTRFGERTRTVRLAENYDNGVYELIARISDSQATLTKLDDAETDYDEDGDPVRQPTKNYSLTAAEADAFVEAWTQYKADRAHALAVEADRQAGVEMEARKLAAEMGLEIEAVEPDYGDDTHFRIKHPVRYVSNTYAYTVEGLLAAVKEFEEKLDAEKQTIAEAREVAKKITELCGDTIHITSQKPAYNGRYDLKIEGKYNGYSTTQVHAEAVLERLQPILTELLQLQNVEITFTK